MWSPAATECQGDDDVVNQIDTDILQEFEKKPKRDSDGAQPKAGLSLGSIMLLAGIVAMFAVLALQLSRQNQIQPMPGETAPEFTLTAFSQVSNDSTIAAPGETFTLADLRGQIVIVNFWGSWCAPCRTEAPDLQAIYEDYSDQGVVLVGVNWLDVEREALAFIEEFGLTYPNGPDVGERIANRYNIQGAPENFIINREGVVEEAVIGSVDYDRLASILDRMLGQA
jgi:cytochrome c biogenesis protein CcmG, thiol:disulfide interchange protein DsbE